MKQKFFDKINDTFSLMPSKARVLAIWTEVLVLALFVVFPLLGGSQASAAQLTNRQVTINTSKSAATAVQYDFEFDWTSASDIEGIIFQFCTTPLGTCTLPNGMDVSNDLVTLDAHTGFPTNGTAFAEQATSTGGCSDTGSASTVTMYCINRTQAASATGTDATVDLGAIINPTLGAGSCASSIYCSVYVRVSLFDNNAFTGNAVHDGVVAAGITQQLTVNARVQENLQFCIGTTTVNDATTSTAADCSAVSGTTVDIGAIDTSVAISPVAASPNAGNNTNGVAMVRTNANNGTVVVYFAEQDTSSGKLKVAGAACSGTSTTDQCFNSQGTTQGTFSGGTENFGMTIGGVNCGSVTAYTCTFASDTYNLRMDAQYEGNTSTAYGTTAGFAWLDTGATDTIASSVSSSTKVLDDESLILRFAATAAATTPTGTYSVVSTYIATPTF